MRGYTWCLYFEETGDTYILSKLRWTLKLVLVIWSHLFALSTSLKFWPQGSGRMAGDRGMKVDRMEVPSSEYNVWIWYAYSVGKTYCSMHTFRSKIMQFLRHCTGECIVIVESFWSRPHIQILICFPEISQNFRIPLSPVYVFIKGCIVSPPDSYMIWHI